MTIYTGDIYNFIVQIDDIFTEEECHQLIEKAESLGMSEVDRGNALYDRSIMVDKELANKLFEKIRHLLPTVFNEKRIIKLNDHFRFSKYNLGGNFGIHRDGFNIDNEGLISLMTLNIFLNEPEEGGSTVFYDNDRNMVLDCKPKAGRGALFYNQILHEGSVVSKGTKYLIRTDVMAKDIYI